MQNPLHCVKVSMLLDRPDKRPSFQLRSRCSMRNWAVTWRKWLHIQPTCTQILFLFLRCVSFSCSAGPTSSFSIAGRWKFSPHIFFWYCLTHTTSSFSIARLWKLFTPHLLLVLLGWIFARHLVSSLNIAWPGNFHLLLVLLGWCHPFNSRRRGVKKNYQHLHVPKIVERKRCNF